ncbi:MAG: 4Fe-4S binding protein [Candidatus Bathyarchaeota archaeon]|nr:MAG: 4Fe-4S binding protein [Candidatus Bathyarchaeota archaeon]
MKIKIDYSKCRNCLTFTCVDCCAKAVYELKEKEPTIVDLDSCTLCEICVELCPNKAITLEK